MNTLIKTLALGLCLVLVGAEKITAQEVATPAEDQASAEEESLTEEAGGSFLQKLAIHGFLTQAYAQSDGNQIVGITKDGTADYRTAALQIRSGITENDTFAVQFSHERLGESPIQAVHDDLELDWIFYERKFGATAIKVGRLPIPFGLYNAVRDVGTILPLYRPARPMYEETSFATETVDGVLLAHELNLMGLWHLVADVHFGSWESFDSRLSPMDAENSLGLELWLHTPAESLKLGLGGLQHDGTIKSPTGTSNIKRQLSHLSLEGSFGRFLSAIEVKRDTSQFETGGTSSRVWGGYVYLGFNLTDHWAAHGEYDYLQVKRPGTDLAKDRDRALGVSYRFRPDLVIKGEYHWAHGFRAENAPGLVPGRPVPDYTTKFGILSLATSF